MPLAFLSEGAFLATCSVPQEKGPRGSPIPSTRCWPISVMRRGAAPVLKLIACCRRCVDDWTSSTEHAEQRKIMKADTAPYVWSPPRGAIVSFFREMNTAIDRFFYDTGSL